MTSNNLKNYRKRVKKIMDATNNGKCWWLYQILIYNPKNYQKRR